MKRRSFLLGSLSLTAGLGLTACSGAAGTEAPATDANGKTVLTVSVWNLKGTPEFQALFDAFEAANPTITVQPVDIVADQYPQKVNTMLAGGDETDVLTMKTMVDYLRWGSKNQLVDLTDLVTGDLSGDPLTNLDAYKIGEQYFAAPYRSDYWLLYYNKTLFDKAGVAYPDNLSWEQYADLAKQFSGQKLANGSQVYGSYQHVWRSTVQAVAAVQRDGDLMSGKYDFMQGQYDMTLDLQKAGAIMDYATAKNNKTTYNSVFSTGQAAMMPMGSWYISVAIQNAKDGTSDFEWGLAPLPQPTAGAPVITPGGPTAFAVNARAKNVDAAKAFVKFAASEEGAKAITKVGIVPALQSDAIRAEYLALDGMPTDDLSKRALAPDTVKLEMPVNERASDVDTILNEEHDLIMVGQASVAEGIQTMDSRVKDELGA